MAACRAAKSADESAHFRHFRASPASAAEREAVDPREVDPTGAAEKRYAAERRYQALSVAPPPDGQESFAAKEVVVAEASPGGHRASAVERSDRASPSALPLRPAQLATPPVAVAEGDGSATQEFVLGSVF
jgi:hypothetical protein